MKIEKLKKGDGARLKPLRIKALESDPDAFGTTADQVKAFPLETWNEQATTLPTFIAVMEGEDVGMVRLGKDHDEPERVGWLISMWVAPVARGRGASVELVRALESECRSQGLSVLRLDVADYNSAAIKLYEKCGFKRTGITGSLPAPREHITEFQMEKLFS